MRLETRAARAADRLRIAETVTEAIYDAGFNSSSRFYESAEARLGMTPGAFRRGGAGAVIRFAVGEASLGAVLVAATNKGVCAILLGDDPQALVRDLQDRFPRAEFQGGDAEFERMVAAGRRPGRGARSAPGSAARHPRHRVPAAGVGGAQRHPCGKTATYREIARAIGQPKAVRAVAQACGANPLAIAIPCHRVVRSDGDLSGYRWGVERKRKLIDREAA